MIGNYYYGTGRRKSAVARVFIRQGSGKFVVNEKPVDEFFTRETGRMIVRQPLKLVNHDATFDIMVKIGIVGGTGYTGVELLRILAQHPEAQITAITSRKEVGMRVTEMYPSLRHQPAIGALAFSDPAEARLGDCDLVFFATPHGVAM